MTCHISRYHRKMSLSKRSQESVLNIVGSFKGVVWRLFEDWGLDKLEKDNAFEDMLKVLDGNFAYDQRVQLPSDFEGYFSGLQRLPGQTLLTYVNDHEEAYRKLLAHKVSLPDAVQGWHLLRRASLTATAPDAQGTRPREGRSHRGLVPDPWTRL